MASLMIEKYLRDTLSQRRLAEVERISQADLLPAAIKRWYQRKDSIRLAKQHAAIDENAQVESKQEDRKVTFDPETGTRTDGPTKDTAKPKQQTPMLRPDEKKNAIKKATTNTRR
jgi:penicillin-binding protein 2